VLTADGATPWCIDIAMPPRNNRAMRTTIVAAALLAAGACNTNRPSASPPSAAPPSSATPPPSAGQPSVAPPSPPKENAELSAATFKGDDLVDCLTIKIASEVESSSAINALKPVAVDQLALMFIDEYVVTSAGGDGQLKHGKSAMTTAAHVLRFPNDRAGYLGLGPKAATMDSAKAQKAVQQLLAMVSKSMSQWPPPSLASRVRNGEVAKVDSCSMPNHVALGTCEVADEGAGLSWSMTDYVFSVAKTVDTDAAMKTCLRMAGKWSAADGADPDVARERMRQHAHKLQHVLGQ
jgi:hypothetical protein